MKKFLSFILCLGMGFSLGTNADAFEGADAVHAGAAAIAAAAAESLEAPENVAENIPVLMYHDVGDVESGLYISEEHFRQHLEYFRDKGYTPVTMSQICAHWTEGAPLPEKPVVLTFDDGYRSMYETVFPMLQEFGYTATFFVIPAARWSDWAVDEAMIKEMSDAGMEIGSHTYNHLQLTLLEEEDMLFELTESKKIIEQLTGREVVSLCYPVGYHNEAVVSAAGECGYKIAVTTRYGLSSLEQGILSLDRIRIVRGDSARLLEYKLSGKLGVP